MKKMLAITLLLSLTGCSAYWYDDYGTRHHRDSRRYEEHRESGKRKDYDKRGREHEKDANNRGRENEENNYR
ncbi:MAG: hypothetical protein HGB23_02550 [Chlorobiaceae bacterium]|nr:hypothetical protein [Chlorobiaceae bacterium]